MSPFVRYTLLRTAVLVVVGALLWLVGLRGLLWAASTVAVAAGLSYLLLTGPREAVLARWAGGREPRGGGRFPGRTPHGGAGSRVSDEDVEDAQTAVVERKEPEERG